MAHPTYDERLAALRATKLEHTRQKQQIIGSMDYDDWGIILPPPERRELVETISGSGVPITDVLLKGFTPTPNHPSGGFFGPKSVGENFRALLETHPTYIDPDSSLAGAYMANFLSYRKPGWNPDIDNSLLADERNKYQVGAGGTQHFCQDYAIGLELGWAGILDKIRRYRQVNAPRAADLHDGLESVVLGIQDWIARHACAARDAAAAEPNPTLRTNLEQMADINARLVAEPPATFREACQWIAWFQMVACMYNGSGSLGRLDQFLCPYYQRESGAGTLSDDEAAFHIACLLLKQAAYIQLGGPDATGHDATHRVSFLVLEAAHRLGIPANVGVCVGESTDPALLERGVEILLADRQGMPKFLGIDHTAEGFARNGFPIELARQRAYSGCHWSALPGCEYALNDCIKINFARILEVAFGEMMDDSGMAPSVANLWDRFVEHLGRAVEVIVACLDAYLEHVHEVFPELVLDLLCHGPIERGEDASHGGVAYTNIGVDGAALATAADSFAALEQRVEQEQRFRWDAIARHLAANWAGPDGEQTRLIMRRIARYGSGRSHADAYALRISQVFTRLVKETPTPDRFMLIPGLFSWAATIAMGKSVGATPNGRRAGEPISHGANPDPGFRSDGAPTAMASAIAAVQPGYGNTAPMQIELDPGMSATDGAVAKVAGLIRSHFAMGGTQVNINVVDTERLLEANADPSRHPDLIVRVTGFSAYFASLSPEFRQLVVDRVVAGG